MKSIEKMFSSFKNLLGSNRVIINGMGKGAYRIYFKIPFVKLGIKIARMDWKAANTLCGFLCGICMNILERRRYTRYVLGQKHPKYRWKPAKYSLCPTYFSCGIFNIVRHVELLPENWWIQWHPAKDEEYHPSCFTEGADTLENFGILNGKVVEVDYADFTIYANKVHSVKELDYK